MQSWKDSAGMKTGSNLGILVEVRYRWEAFTNTEMNSGMAGEDLSVLAKAGEIYVEPEETGETVWC